MGEYRFTCEQCERVVSFDPEMMQHTRLPEGWVTWQYMESPCPCCQREYPSREYEFCSVECRDMFELLKLARDFVAQERTVNVEPICVKCGSQDWGTHVEMGRKHGRACAQCDTIRWDVPRPPSLPPVPDDIYTPAVSTSVAETLLIALAIIVGVGLITAALFYFVR